LRNDLARVAFSHLPNPLDWDENPTAPYFTDKPAGTDIRACCSAAYKEHLELPIPADIPKDFAQDQAIRRSMGAKAKTAYPSLVSNAQFWLPVRISFVF